MSRAPPPFSSKGHEDRYTSSPTLIINTAHFHSSPPSLRVSNHVMCKIGLTCLNTINYEHRKKKYGSMLTFGSPLIIRLPLPYNSPFLTDDRRMIKTGDWTIPDLGKYLVSVQSMLQTIEIEGLQLTPAFLDEGTAEQFRDERSEDFLWKQAHGIYRLGSFWSNIPECDERAVCRLCDQTETFQHIIEKCRSTETVVVWQATNELWKRKYDENLTTTEGAILGCGLANFTREDGKPDTAKNRLYRIIISEASHLIWVLRCERRIQGTNNPDQNHLERVVRKRWYNKINERMQIDCLLTNKYLYENKALKTKTVYRTWANCSTNEEDLHREWCRHPGVLVGRTPAENG